MTRNLFFILASLALAALILVPAAPVSAVEPAVRLVLGDHEPVNWEIGPIAPGESGIKTVNVQNAGSQPGNLSIWLSNIRNIDGTPGEFETHTPEDLGEMGSFLTFSLSGNQVNSNIEFPATMDDLPHSTSDSLYIRVWPLNAGDTVILNWEWNLPAEAGNIVQGDTVSFDINYTLEEISSEPTAGGGGDGDGGGFGGGGGGFSGGDGPSSSTTTTTTTPKPTPARFVEIDLLGNKVKREVSADNKFLESYVGKTEDDSLTISFSKGTSILTASTGNPSRIVVDIYPQTVTTGVNEVIVGYIYRIEVYDDSGNVIPATFSPLLLITRTYIVSDLPKDTKSIYLNYYDTASNCWRPLDLPYNYSGQTGQLSAMVGQGLLFAAVANIQEKIVPPIYTPSPGYIEIKNLTANPETLQLGDSVIIRGEAVNTGESTGEQVIEFKVPGLTSEALKVKLMPGQRQKIEYTITPPSAGEYEFILGEARGKFNVVTNAPEGINKALNLFFPHGGDGGFPYWWMILLVIVILVLIYVFILEKRKHSNFWPTSTIEIVSGLTRRLTQPKPIAPIVESIAGPTHRLKEPGPNKYSIKVTGGKPPYTVEWKGNKLICSGTDCEEVEILNNQTWDSGKGHWVFFTVKDSNGKYAQWVNSEGVIKRLFTYGISYKNTFTT